MQDIYIYSAHVPTVYEWALYYFRVASALAGSVMYYTLLINQVVKEKHYELSILA